MRTILLGGIALVLSLRATNDLVAAERPNVLFIAVDDLRPELGCYGAKHIHSPNIDRLGRSGVIFQRAYCQQAVCSPSRTSLLTGLRPDSTKVYDLQTHFRDTIPDVITLPQHFRANGYYAVGMGKIYHGGLDDAKSWSEPWHGSKRPTYQRPENVELIAKKQQAAKQRRLKGKALTRAARGPATELADVSDDAYHDGALAEMAVESLQKLAEKDQPFFLAVGFIRPHLPFVAPKKYWDLYNPDDIQLADNPYPPKSAPPFALTNFGELRNYDDMPEQGPVSAQQARRLKHGYYAALSYMDAQVGKLLDELERLELRDNTIVVLWGDHGWKLGEHGEWCKHTNFENDTHVPLIVSAPGIAPKRTTALVEFVDIYPSLCELAGLPLPTHLEGSSFAPLMRNDDAPQKSAAFSQYPRSHQGRPLMGYSMRTDRYRLTVWVHRKDPNEIVATELYDHKADPAENVNVAEDPQYQSLLPELMRQWKAGWKGARPATNE